jgi:glucosyl-dolichyl phosphate glucuronosyltransferase
VQPEGYLGRSAPVLSLASGFETMNITLLVCTYNRCESLTKTLNNAVALKLPESIDWEILVVDNNSKDQTRGVIRDFERRYPSRFRYVFESQQGLCYARNAGIREARGEIIAFLDDDVTTEPTWLQNLTATLHDDLFVGAGGRILPEHAFSAPRWLPLRERYALAPLCMFDVGLEAGRLTEPPIGANMAFRKEMFEKYGYFRTDLGRIGNSLLSNEDTEFGHRLLNAGEPLWYEPSAVVFHPVSESRLRKGYFLAWWFGKGRSDIRQFGIPPNTKLRYRGIPLYLFRNLAVWTVRWMISINPSLRFSCKLKVWGKAGQILECWQSSKTSECTTPIVQSGVSERAK